GKMADSKIYHFDEVAQHKGAKDCWLIISGKVKLTASHLSDLLFIGKSFIFSLHVTIWSYINQDDHPFFSPYCLLQVYDVTPFMDEHPGGDDVLLTASGNHNILFYCFASHSLLHQKTKKNEKKGVTKRIKSHGFPCCKYSNKYAVFAGKDATNDFEDIGHSNAAQEMMDKYYIGKIDTSTIPTKDTTVQKQLVIQKPDNSQEFVIKILQFLLPVIILGLAFAVRHFTKVD
ncbi:hypothetical protein BHM03_00039909, partial [Ensete ventricosum]